MVEEPLFVPDKHIGVASYTNDGEGNAKAASVHRVGTI
jgi:hypothetical protein